MKRYLVWRDQRALGPYSGQQIMEQGLLPMDLVCEEGETEWKSATSVQELKPFVKNYSLRGLFEMDYPNELPNKECNEKPMSAAEKESDVYAGPGILQKSYKLSLAAVLVGLIVSVFFIKKIVDIIIENGFKTSRLIHTPLPKDKIADKTYQNALVTEFIPPAPVAEKKEVKASSPRAIRRQIKVTGNQYTVGYFGGIHGLQLKVNNGSDHFVNQVEVEIDYLKKNGDIIHTDSYRVMGMKPHSIHILAIPPTTKGVKVKYRILNIYSRQHRNLLKLV